MDYVSLCIIILAAIVGVLSYVLVKAVTHLAEVNKQLLIVVAGKDQKPEALRALVATNKPPQGKLKGIAGDGKKQDSKTKNVNHTIEVGVH